MMQQMLLGITSGGGGGFTLAPGGNLSNTTTYTLSPGGGGAMSLNVVDGAAYRMVVSSDFTAKVKVWGAGGASGTQNPSAGGGGGNAVADVLFQVLQEYFGLLLEMGWIKIQHCELAFRGGGGGADQLLSWKWWRIFWYFCRINFTWQFCNHGYVVEAVVVPWYWWRWWW